MPSGPDRVDNTGFLGVGFALRHEALQRCACELLVGGVAFAGGEGAGGDQRKRRGENQRFHVTSPVVATAPKRRGRKAYVRWQVTARLPPWSDNRPQGGRRD